MKKITTSLCSFLIVTAAFSQSVKLSATPEGASVFVNSAPASKIRTDAPYGAIAYKPGYVTQGKTSEEFRKEGGSEYTFKLVKDASKLPTGTTTRKIEMTKLADGTGQLNRPTVNMGFYGIYQGIDLSDAKYVKAISTQMSDLGYKVVGTNAMFSGKSDVADLALGGEVVWFAKDTRGAGFQISVIVHWTVFDVKKENIVFELTTAGYSDTKVTLLNEELSKAFQDATRGLLNDAKFKELAVKKGDDVNAKGEKEASLELPKIAKKTYASYGDMVKNVVNACLTVKTNFGHGSGFLVSEDGYILTNNHVVSGADKIDVVFDNGFSFEAKLIKANEDRDVALLKISGSGFKALPLGTSDDASVGTEVVAIGTPQDIKLGQTVTKGIVSGKREMEEKNFIQTDVAINSGNSGGPLINSSGEVIGIIVAKVFGKSVEGLGFAIPINEAIKKLNLKLE